MRNTQTQFNGKQCWESDKTQQQQDLKHSKGMFKPGKNGCAGKNVKNTFAQINRNNSTCTCFSKPRHSLLPKPHPYKCTVGKERLSASRYGFRVSCIIQGAPARPELRPKGGAPTSQGRACVMQHIWNSHPEADRRPFSNLDTTHKAQHIGK